MLKAILPVMVMLAVGVATSTEPPSKEKLAPNDKQKQSDALKKKFYRSWIEIERVDAGATIKEPIKLYGLLFATDGYGAWNRRGELAAGAGYLAFDSIPRPSRCGSTSSVIRARLRRASGR